MEKKASAEKAVREIRRKTRRRFSAEEKIRIVIEGLRGEESIASLCRREGIVANLYYRWSKEFLEAGKKRLLGIGRRRWKKESGYHRQARVENVFFRYNSIIGDQLRARHPKSQEAEALMACNIPNRMTILGRPESFAIGA